MKKPKPKKRVVKSWWIRKGNDVFAFKNVWRNWANARLAAKGLHFADTKSHKGKSEYKVIPLTITYEI